MREFFLCLSLLTCCSYNLQAQRELSNPLIDSKTIIARGNELYGAGKYKEAIAEYLKVSPSDTSYTSVLYELILTYYKDSNFVEAERLANTALALYPHQNSDWYSLLADVYDDTKRTDLALKAYDTILSQNPYAYVTYFNKGISLFRLSRYDEAEVNFRKCVILNPYYSSAHYFLGQLSMLKGNMVEAMLSFSTNLLIAPESRYHSNATNFLNTISEVNTTAEEYLRNYKPGKEDNFEDLQEIVTSKIALDKKYKLKAGLEDKIVRQLQVIMEKLEYHPNDKGFWMQYYVPLFKNIWDTQNFEAMVYYMFSGLDIKEIKEYNKKEKKKIEAFSNTAVNYLNNLRKSQELQFDKRTNAGDKYYIKNYVVSGKGPYGLNSKNEEILTGPWEFYFDNGSLKSKGTFDNDGNRNGEWLYYFENGILKEKSSYINDKANGKVEVWSDNGLLYTTSTYASDKREGVETYYYYGGKLSSVINYKDDKKEGEATYYNADGILSAVTSYKNDQEHGKETVYHINGKIKSAVNYEKGLATGEYTEYFDNGKLKTKGNYSGGKKTGIWNSYFKDGKPSFLENYNNGDLEGEWASYYENGKTETKKFYKKGEIDGTKEDFDDDGIKFSESVFERGRLRDIKFFDKKGTVVSNTTSRKGNANVPFYSPDGLKTSDGYYTKDGQLEGLYTYYYKNGKISMQAYYKEGLQNGKKTFYYANEKISEEGSYKDDKADGYFINYYNNGQLSGEGWYVNDQRQGTFINYNLLGNLTSTNYYINDKVHGISESFTPTGKTDYKQYYDYGWFNKIEQYDSTGKIITSSELNKGEGKLRFNHFNGTPYFESNYKNYKLNGPYKITNGDGSKRALYFYKNGELDSTYMFWHPNGKVQVEGAYKNGGRTGAWKYYNYDGKLFETEHYTEGKLDGDDIQYNEDGSKDNEFFYKNGDLNGEMKYFGNNGELMLILFYKDDNLIGYTYEGKDGKPLPMIPLPTGTGILDAYYKTGVKSAHIVFNEGLVNGERIFYYSSGKEKSTGARINGLENGIKKTYYPNGKIKKEENYYYGEKHGTSMYYNQDGSLISALNFYLGGLNGDCKYYTSGKMPQTYAYYYGILESKK